MWRIVNSTVVTMLRCYIIKNKNTMEKFYTDKSNGGLRDGFLNTALLINEKKLTYQNGSQSNITVIKLCCGQAF